MYTDEQRAVLRDGISRWWADNAQTTLQFVRLPDLAKYRAQYGLPACTTSNGCFTAHAFGTQTNVGWAAEESLDVDMVSAICPNCKILLVEAKSPTTGNLVTAEMYATAHANYVSNSWSGNECCKAKSPDFDVPGVAITAATGDNGHNSVAQWPAILPTVIAVGD